MTGLSKLLFHNEEFIPEVSEDSSTVHVGTAMFCQVGSEVCLHFEVNLSRIYFYLFGSEIFSATRFSLNRIFCGSHKWPRNTEQRTKKEQGERGSDQTLLLVLCSHPITMFWSHRYN